MEQLGITIAQHLATRTVILIIALAVHEMAILRYRIVSFSQNFYDKYYFSYRQ